MTLTEFLLARIAEDETAELHDLAICAWANDDCLSFNGPECDCGWAKRKHLECEAKRRIVENHEQAWNQVRPSGRRSLWGRHTWGGLSLSLRCLSLPYADHPDYQQEWAL